MSTVDAVRQVGREEEAELDLARDVPKFITFGTTGSNVISASIPGPTPNNLIISNNEKMMVTIDFDDGSIVFGEGYTPDAAAKIFWEAIGNYRKD